MKYLFFIAALFFCLNLAAQNQPQQQPIFQTVTTSYTEEVVIKGDSVFLVSTTIQEMYLTDEKLQQQLKRISEQQKSQEEEFKQKQEQAKQVSEVRAYFLVLQGKFSTILSKKK